MRSLLVVALLGLLVPLAPASALPYSCTEWPTTNAAEICAGEIQDEGSCGRNATEVSYAGVAGAARVAGHEGCTAGYEYNEIGLFVCPATGGCFVAGWTELHPSRPGCVMGARLQSTSSPGVTLPCLVGSPPNPGWGRLLP